MAEAMKTTVLILMLRPPNYDTDYGLLLYLAKAPALCLPPERQQLLTRKVEARKDIRHF